MSGTQGLVASLVAFGGLILLFLVCREIVTWYWKLNRIVELLEQIEQNTRSQALQNTNSPSRDSSTL